MPDAVARGLRTFLQAGLLNALLALLVAFGVPVSPEQQKAILAFSAALGLFVTAYCAMEDSPKVALPALLKPGPPAETPVGPPSDGGGIP